VAVSVGAGPAAATAVAGAISSLALSRWRPGWPVVVALVGLVALGAGADLAPLATLALATAAWTRAERAEPGPEFSAIVLVAILAFATAALTLLTIGQFEAIDDVAVAVAAVTVLAGMARAGLTVTDRLRETQQQALTDDLTGLANRRHLMERLHAAVRSASEHGGEFAFLLIDLDGFKELNDTLGHQAGDRLLIELGARLAATAGEDSIVARLGGDEFAVLLNHVPDERAAQSVAQRVTEALSAAAVVDDLTLSCRAGVGLSYGPDVSMARLREADMALYAAKAAGKGRWHQYHHDMGTAVPRSRPGPDE
jgi:diguanylate cyclase (GGDEF)-like protein